MKPVDFVKALGVALLVMVLDLLCAVIAVTLWSRLTGPHPALSPTDPQVIAVSSLSTRICGPILFVLFVWLFSRKRPDRNAWAFAASVFGFYFLIDWAMVAFQGIFTVPVLITTGLKILGAFVGAWLARRRAAPNPG